MRKREVVVTELKQAVKKERLSTLQVLQLLREVERDRHHLAMAYPSLFEFATRELEYSEGSAQRRINAMRLLKNLPELEPRIEDGSLSLCVAAKTQSFFRQEDQKRKGEGKSKLTLETKKEIAQSLVGVSKRQCERKLAEISPESALPKEKARPVAPNKTLVQFVADDELMQKLERLKGLLAHQNFEGRIDKLVELLADLALNKLDPMEKAQKVKKAKSAESTKNARIVESAKEAPAAMTPKTTAAETNTATTTSPPPVAVNQTPTRYVPAAMDREVRTRDGHQCTFIDSETGRRCPSRHALELDHVIPFAWGGPSTTGNLRLRCGAHNRFTAEQMGLLDGRSRG